MWHFRLVLSLSFCSLDETEISHFIYYHHDLSLYCLCSRGLSSFYSFQGASEEPLFPRNNPMAIMFVSLLGCGRRARARGGGGVIENRQTSQSSLCLCTVSSVRIIRRNIKASPSYFPHSSSSFFQNCSEFQWFFC